MGKDLFGWLGGRRDFAARAHVVDAAVGENVKDPGLAVDASARTVALADAVFEREPVFAVAAKCDVVAVADLALGLGMTDRFKILHQKCQLLGIDKACRFHRERGAERGLTVVFDRDFVFGDELVQVQVVGKGDALAPIFLEWRVFLQNHHDLPQIWIFQRVDAAQVRDRIRVFAHPIDFGEQSEEIIDSVLGNGRVQFAGLG